MKARPFISQVLAGVLAACGNGTSAPAGDASVATDNHVPQHMDAGLERADASTDAGPPLATHDGGGDTGGGAFVISGLPQGSHLGVFDGYELPSAAAAASVAARRAELRAAGSDVSRVHVSFRELSPEPGRVELAPLLDAIDGAGAEDHLVLLIETVDSDGFSDAMPSDLAHADAPYALRGGLALDAPAVVERFADVLRAFHGTAAFARVVALSVGNEPDAYYDDVAPTSPAGKAYAAALGGFVSGARDALRAAGSRLPVAMTLRGALVKEAPDTLRQLVAQGDVAVFNYYCQDPDFRVIPESRVALDLAQLASAAQGKPVILQEVGCPAGRSGGRLGSSDASQAAFFSALVAGMQTSPQLRVAFVFQLVDWSPGLASSYGASYARAGYPELGATVEESLSTAGLLRYADGSARPAFEVVRMGIAELTR